jgi:alkylation response protein AidB-like acyl-CoA dehydrogenase
MERHANPEHRELFERITAFARKELNQGVEERDRSETFSLELWKKCGEMGLQGLPVPESMGGVGLDALSSAIALEAFGYGCKDGGLVFSVCAHLLACVVPVWKYGSEEQRARILPALASGEKIAVNAITEPDSGSDGFRIQGRKTFSSNGPIADVALVYAATAPSKRYHGGVTAFLVERGTPGFSVGQTFHKMGLRTAPISELVLDDVRVPASAVVGRVGAAGPMFNESMEWERVLLPAAHLGAIRRLLETAIDYARTRRAFGKPIGKFQAVSHRIVDMKVRLEAGRLLVHRAAARLGARDAGLDASIAKLWVSESLVTSALDTIRVLGGYGYMQEYEVERTLRDGVASVLYSGTSDMQRNVIASWLGL